MIPAQGAIPVYNISINSAEDIERAFNNADEQKISKILNPAWSMRSVVNIEKDSNCLCIGHLYREVYRRSLGFSTCAEIVKGVESYHELLKYSLFVCKDALTMLFINSFQRHQMVIPYYAMETPQEEDAIAKMVEIGGIAKMTRAFYKKIREKFDLFRDQEAKKMTSLVEKQVLVMTQQRLLEQRQKIGDSCATDSLRVPILKAGVAHLDAAIQSLWKLIANLDHFSLLLSHAKIRADCLAEPTLADPILIECIVSRKPGDRDEFADFLIAAEISAHQPQKSFAEVTAAMKTGRDLSSPSKTPLKGGIAEELESMLKRGIEDEFENSYLSWLVLAKQNQTMVNALTKAIAEIEKVQEDILQIEKDPLAIALTDSFSKD